jgi:uridine kinase
LLKKKLKEKYKINIIHQDSYYQTNLPKIYDTELKEEVIDWEIPICINWDNFYKDITESKQNHDLTIVEGFLVYHEKTIQEIFELKFFINVDSEIFKERRRKSE